VLLNEGCEVFVADSGVRALEMAAAVRPDLILLDLMMPGMDGLETCERLKMLDEVRDIPVVILTAAGDEHFVVDSFAVGAVDYVCKPFAPAVLVARAATHIQLYRRTRELERLAHIDVLTGLPNRRAFEQRLGEDWQRCRRADGILGVLMLDVDRFKQYNDYYGHPQGDRALRAVAAALQGSARRVVDFCGRYGGEEFVVLTLSDGNAAIEELAARIGDAVRGLGIEHAGIGAGARLTVSIGYACVSPRDALNPPALIKAADQALYRAKANGRDRAERALLNTGD
jgi:diguanylate cyclase (GGDEF)-like protein